LCKRVESVPQLSEGAGLIEERVAELLKPYHV
jgi:hypothetical protein